MKTAEITHLKQEVYINLILMASLKLLFTKL